MLDWRNPEEYSYLGDYSLHEWAWEFLRRGADYRSDYAQWQAALAEFRSAPTREYNHPVDRALGLYASLFYTDACNRWDLSQLIDPEVKAREAWINFKSRAGVEMPIAWQPEPKEGDLWPGYPYHLTLQFDFRFDINTQLAIARERLERFAQYLREKGIVAPPPAPSSKGLRVSQFPLYVRLLDAELWGAGINEMGRVLLPDRADSRNNVKVVRDTARRMASTGYRKLLLLPPYAR